MNKLGIGKQNILVRGKGSKSFRNRRAEEYRKEYLLRLIGVKLLKGRVMVAVNLKKTRKNINSEDWDKG